MKVTQLDRDMLKELKTNYLSQQVYKKKHRCLSDGELADADELVSDKTIFAEYADVEFTKGCFYCTMGRYNW